MSYRDTLRVALPVDEGTRDKPYRDTVGKLTIGVGRNLDDVGVNEAEIALMLENDITRAEAAARRLVANFDELSDGRKAVVINMAFNLGERLAGFTATLTAIREGRFADAADEMLKSKWATQVGARARRLSAAMRFEDT